MVFNNDDRKWEERKLLSTDEASAKVEMMAIYKIQQMKGTAYIMEKKGQRVFYTYP